MLAARSPVEISPAAPNAGTADPLTLPRLTGKVDRWLNGKGIGWIVPDGGGEKVFVHVRGLAWDVPGQRKEFKSLREGERVEYVLMQDSRDPTQMVAWDVTGPDRGPVQGGYDRGELVGWRQTEVKEVYVGNLAFSTGWKELKAHFEKVGRVKQAKVATDELGRSKGWGTVRYSRPGHARDAIAEFHGSMLEGREIYVKLYKPKTHVDFDDDDGEPLLPWT